jgi:uncharacterized protein (DUF2252 family)
LLPAVFVSVMLTSDLIEPVLTVSTKLSQNRTYHQVLTKTELRFGVQGKSCALKLSNLLAALAALETSRRMRWLSVSLLYLGQPFSSRQDIRRFLTEERAASGE